MKIWNPVSWVGWPLAHSNGRVSTPCSRMLGSVGRGWVLLEKKIGISLKLVSRWKHAEHWKTLADICVDFGVDVKHRTHTKTAADNTAPQITTDCWNFTLDFRHYGVCASQFFFQTSKTVICKQNATFAFVLKENFGPLSKFSSSSLAEVRHLWCLCFRSAWISLPESAVFDNPLKGVIIFFAPFLATLAVNFLNPVMQHSREQPAFSAMTSCVHSQWWSSSSSQLSSQQSSTWLWLVVLN